MKRILAVMVVIMGILCLAGCIRVRDDSRPLACLAMSSVDSSFTRSLTDSLTNMLKDEGYRTQVIYCEDDAGTQLSQIENFVGMEPDMLVLDLSLIHI